MLLLAFNAKLAIRPNLRTTAYRLLVRYKYTRIHHNYQYRFRVTSLVSYIYLFLTQC